jgi:lipoprotein
MKKYIIAVVMTVLLTGCADKNTSASSTVKEETSAPETTAETTFAEEITSTGEITSTVETTAEPVSDGYNFKVEADGIYFFEGSIFQKIELDCSEFLESVEKYDKAPEEFLTIADFNFDGYDDLFVPNGVGAPNVHGTYFYMNPTRDFNPFEKWDELNKIGFLMSVDSENKILNFSSHISAVDHDWIIYKWNNGKLQPVSRELQYNSVYDNKIYIDRFEYDDDGKESLVKRERALLGENNEWQGTEEVEFPHSYTFSLNENSIEVILDGGIVQTLECDTTVDEKRTFFEDYDFDGYNDLFIMNEDLSGVYYRYVPDTGLYEKWDELNEVGKLLNVGMSIDLSIGKCLVHDDLNGHTFIYKWSDGNLVLAERSENVTDENTGESATQWYIIDENGNEVLRDDSGR